MAAIENEDITNLQDIAQSVPKGGHVLTPLVKYNFNVLRLRNWNMMFGTFRIDWRWYYRYFLS